MNSKLLNLTPSRLLCPYCGKWHKWNPEHELGYYNSNKYQAKFICPNIPYAKLGFYRFYFSNGYCYYFIGKICDKANQSIVGRIPIFSIIESSDKPIVTFEVPFIASNNVGLYECSDCVCEYQYECIYLDLGEKGDKRHMNITLGFEFEQADFSKL